MQEAITPIYLALPFPPSVNNMFVNGRAGKGRFVSPAYKAWRTEAGLRAKMQNKHKINGPFAVQINAVRPDKRRRDLDNICKAVLDLMVALHFIEDDSEAQYIEMRWVTDGPPLWLALRPCTRWATDIQSSQGEAKSNDE